MFWIAGLTSQASSELNPATATAQSSPKANSAQRLRRCSRQMRPMSAQALRSSAVGVGAVMGRVRSGLKRR